MKASGRWRSDSSVKRHAKAARSLSEAADYDPQILRFGPCVKEALAQLFVCSVAILVQAIGS